jgi:hypothetical protein
MLMRFLNLRLFSLEFQRMQRVVNGRLNKKRNWDPFSCLLAHSIYRTKNPSAKAECISGKLREKGVYKGLIGPACLIS